ncbi:MULTISPECIES: LLM class flavin-dependent oxidoreductase [unclassified Streptomyces]|uniref:LLM class flavin-dependent oxidoreductase n=1 Tax=unclassified Streptomyces TaxID=2593676 RepID=UPI002E81B3A1|nr:LLM class flavin-dependent oxidoreductase [Streptomyces sp. NBC_00562]
MPDYGHDLRFGAFLTPTAEDHDEVIRLARLADGIGLDLIGIQDHPYQPAFLDTWTLLTHLAAHTDRVTLFPHVANLPLRPPAVLARSAATLDILSGGRTELGIGAGAFWDAITALGGPRRTPAEAVDALEEAIAVIRAMWAPGPAVGVAGRHYRLDGARPGPFPAHPLGIWIGSYKKRMLEVTGRLGDGWLPSSAYAPPGDLAAMSQTLDDAAHAAGRDPAQIQRIYTVSGRFSHLTSDRFLDGPPEQWARELTELALAHGISGFVLAPSGADPERELRTFTEEVAPRVREAIAAARGVQPVTDTRSPAPPVAPARTPQSADLWPADPLDEATRPRAPKQQTGPALGNTGARLTRIHDNLRDEMRQITDAVAQVAAGQRDAASARSMINSLTLRQNYWTLGTFCTAYSRTLTTHHTIEDQYMFPELREKQASLGPVVERLEHEHEVIAEALARLDAALVTLVQDDGRIGEVQDLTDVLERILLSHLGYEEEELVEPLDRLGINV